MRILKHKRRAQNEIELRKLSDKELHWQIYEFGRAKFIPLSLVKENNRGWTFENYTLTCNRTVFFFSRGEWEMIEE